MEVQTRLGADLIMAFDECPPYPAEREVVEAAVGRTTRWAARSQAAHHRQDQWLLGIVQGGVFDDLRERSARELLPLGFPGYAIGGLSVGEPKEDMRRVLDVLDPILPAEKPRYLMGVGTPEDLVEGIANGANPQPTFADGLQVQQVLEAVERSSDNDSAWTRVAAGVPAPAV